MSEGHVGDQIAGQMLAVGVQPGGVLLVHSALSSLGRLSGGSETVVRALLAAIGPEGTLLMPALSYKHVNESSPAFDALVTPSNVGAIPEHFRTRPGTLRSMHPTHSVCGVGPRAAELLADHHLDTTPVGANSPFRRLRDVGGQIFMLGCGLGPNTSMHGIEELVEPDYLFSETTEFTLIHADLRQTTMLCRRHDFAGWVQRYERIGPLLESGGMTVGKVLEATVHLIDAQAMWPAGLEALRKDPLYFVDRK